MQSLSSKENFFIGLSLSNSSNYDSSISVLDRNANIIMIDKFYFAPDIEYFFETSPYVKNSIVCATVAYDNKILDGKWRIHSKNYKMLGDNFKINRNNWTERLSTRCENAFKYLKKQNIKTIRTDINQLRQSYKLEAYNLARTSLDCKNLQSAMKIKFNLDGLPDNMLSASALEAILCSIFAMEYTNGIETSTIFKMDDIPILERKFDK